MIDFACKTFEIEEIVKCSLGLSKSEFKILKFLIENKDGWSSEKLAKELKLDKTTIQRAVKNLYHKDLVRRSQRNLTTGGYVFVYSIKDKKEIKDKIRTIIDDWVENVHKGLNRW